MKQNFWIATLGIIIIVVGDFINFDIQSKPDLIISMTPFFIGLGVFVSSFMLPDFSDQDVSVAKEGKQ